MRSRGCISGRIGGLGGRGNGVGESRGRGGGCGRCVLGLVGLGEC